MRSPTPSTVGSERLVTRPFAMVAGATFLFFLYVGVQVPLMPRLIEERLGGHEFDIGLNLAVFSVSAILIRPALGRFGDRHGLRLMMAYGAMLTSSATVGSSFMTSRWTLLPLRGVQGVGEAALFVGGASLINGFAPAARRAEAASYFSVAVFGGIGVGPIVGEWVVGREGHFQRGLLVAAAFALCGSIGAWFVPQSVIDAATIDEPKEVRDAGPAPRYHPAALRPGLVMALGIAGYTSFSAFMPEHAKDVGLGGSQWVFATYSVTCLVLRLVAAKLPERIGLARAVSVALGGLLCGLVVLAAVPTIPGVFIAAMLLAVGMSFQYPSLMALAVNSAPEHERIRVISTFTMFFEVGTVTGGLVLGTTANLTSKRGGFAGGAVLAGLGLILLWRWLVPWAQRGAAERRMLAAGPGVAVGG